MVKYIFFLLIVFFFRVSAGECNLFNGTLPIAVCLFVQQQTGGGNEPIFLRVVSSKAIQNAQQQKKILYKEFKISHISRHKNDIRLTGIEKEGTFNNSSLVININQIDTIKAMLTQLREITDPCIIIKDNKRSIVFPLTEKHRALILNEKSFLTTCKGYFHTMIYGMGCFTFLALCIQLCVVYKECLG